MTIHLLTHEFYPRKGGAATYCVEMATAVQALDQDIRVWAPRYEALGSPKPFPFPVESLPVKGSQGWLGRIKLRKTFRNKIQPRIQSGDILHIAEAGPLITGLTFPELFFEHPGSTRITIHGTELIRFPHSWFYRKRFERFLHQADGIHVLSKYNQRKLLDLFPKLHPKVIQIPGGPRTLPKSSILPLKKDTKTCILLTLGRIHPRKGQATLISYLSALPRALKSQIELWVVGPITKHKYFRQCTRLAKNSGVQVRFLHGCPDSSLPDLLRKADVFILPSMPYGSSVEGLGLVNLEAAQHGLPIVAHQIGGVAETLQEGKTGFLVQPGDTPAFCAALETLIGDPDLRRKMGENAREFCRKFSWEQAARRVYLEPFSQSSRNSPYTS